MGRAHPTNMDIAHDKSTSHFNLWLLFTIILIEGFVSISIEILAIRQLIPFVGNSVIVTSLIIGIFLLFLAIGYRRGGFYEKDYRHILKMNFTKTIIWTGLGLSYAFCALFFYLCERMLSHQILLVLTIYLLLIIAPIIYILGQTLPICTNLFRREHTVGAISGKALFLSTLGSFLGAVLTTLILFNYVGVAWTIVINVGLLAVLVALLVQSFAEDILLLTAIIASMFLVLAVNLNYETLNFLRTDNYGNYQYQADYTMNNGRQVKAFIINNSLSSVVDDKQHAADYIEKIKQVLFDQLQLKNKQILVLGAGGFSLSAESTNGNHFTYVDLNKHLPEMVTQHFIEKINGKFVVADARVFLKNKLQQYDVIVGDTYNNGNAIPAYLLTEEYLMDVRRSLKPNGLAVFNIIANPMLNNAYSKRVDNTINQVFPNCMKIPIPYWDNMANILYFCQKSVQEHDKMLYKDNLNRATIDFYFAVAKQKTR